MGSNRPKTEKLDFLPKNIFCSIWRFRAFWRDRMERTNIAHRFGPRVSNFLSYRIVVFIKIDDFRNIAFVIFSILRQIQNGTSFRKKNSGTTTPGTASKIQYLNIIQIFKISKNIVKNDQLVFKPWLLAEIWVSKNPGFVHGFSKDFPPHGFPTPWILDFRGGRGSGRQKTWGGVGWRLRSFRWRRLACLSIQQGFNTVPAVRKDACTLLTSQAKKPKNLLS